MNLDLPLCNCAEGKWSLTKICELIPCLSSGQGLLLYLSKLRRRRERWHRLVRAFRSSSMTFLCLSKFSTTPISLDLSQRWLVDSNHWTRIGLNYYLQSVWSKGKRQSLIFLLPRSLGMRLGWRNLIEIWSMRGLGRIFMRENLGKSISWRRKVMSWGKGWRGACFKRIVQGY